MAEPLPEYWLRGPVEAVSPVLQPVAHALLQAREEIRTALEEFPQTLLWSRPRGVASVAFHLQHMTGVVDRLFTYARGEALTPDQLASLAAEGMQPATPVSVDVLLDAFDRRVEAAIAQLRVTDEGTLLESRAVGRKRLPSTVLGLLFHAAEHVQRHLGQTLVTVRVLNESIDRSGSGSRERQD